jgi:hypothetical protein
MIFRTMTTTLALCVCLASAVGGQAPKKPLRAAGRVDAVTQDSITVALPGDNKITLTVDKATKLTGRGLDTKSATSGSTGIDGLVKPSDSVVVTYSEAGGKLHASEVHVRLITK